MTYLSINQVGKRYQQDFWAVKNFSLQLEPGVVGLLGPNGAGKSTLMRMIATITDTTDGKITWKGINIAEKPDDLRTVLGYLPQDFGVYPNLNAFEFLQYIASIKGLDGKVAKRRIDELLHLVNLMDVAKRPVGGYSGGMRQRVGIAQALLNDPELLIVDEPTAGLDPEERVRFRTLIADLSGERIVILSTHIVSDVEATAGSIAIMNRGALVVHASPEKILQAVEGKVWRWIVDSHELASIKQKYMISGTTRRSDGVYVRVIADEKPDPMAELSPANLEDAYIFFVSGAGRASSHS